MTPAGPRHALWRSLSVGASGVRCVLGVAVLFLSAACSKGPIWPLRHDVFLLTDDHDAYALDVRLDNSVATYGPVNILFLFDATNSMQNVILSVASEATAIMRSVREANPKTEFAVASFADYNSPDPVWELHQDVTSDLDLLSGALDRIRLRHGEDYPEAYARALFESRFVDWREGAQRFIILFGDAPAHDPDFYGLNFGVDPGRDRLPGTADDLPFETVVKQLAGDRIKVITIYDRGDTSEPKPYAEETLRGFRHLASTTGGVSKTIGSAEEVADAIRSALVELPKPTPRVDVGSDYHRWVEVFSQSRASDVEGMHTFQVLVRPPADAAPGVHRIPLKVSVGEGPNTYGVGESLLIVRLGWLAFAWFWPVLASVLALVFLLAFLAFGRRRRENRLEGTRQGLYLIWRIVVLVLVVGLPIMVALRLPETPGDLMALVSAHLRL